MTQCSHHPNTLYNSFISKHIDKLISFAKNKADFSRDRILGITNTICHALHMTCEKNANGYALSAHLFFKNIKSDHRKVIEKAPSAAAICKARDKLNYEAFEFLLEKSHKKEPLWKGHRVRCADGSMLTLPNSKEIHEEFPIRFNNGVAEYYPMAKVMTVISMGTYQPLSMTLESYKGSEREMFISMLDDHFSKGDVCVLDRGLSGIDFWKRIKKKGIFFLSRVKKCDYIKYLGNKKEVIIEKKGIKLRVIRSPESKIILVTNLLNTKKYKRKELVDLYYGRWMSETMYLKMKDLLKLEKFHSRKVNGIKQEVLSNLLVISLISGLASEMKKRKNIGIGYKAAIEILKTKIVFLILPITSHLLEELKEEMSGFDYKKRKGRSYRRFSKQSENRWIRARRKNNHVNYVPEKSMRDGANKGL